MIVQHHLVFGRKYGEISYLKYKTQSSRIYMSTRSNNVFVSSTNNSIYNEVTMVKNRDFITTPPSTQNGSIQITGGTLGIENTCAMKNISGNKDVYSLGFFNFDSTSTSDTIFIDDVGVFLNQFNNLYSLYFNWYGAPITIKGDISQIPNILERIQINNLLLQNTTDLYLNVSNFSSSSLLHRFEVVFSPNISFVNIYGDLSKLPPQIQFFSLARNNANTFTYTQGKTWASSFDTLNLGNAKLFTTDTDNLLIDMNNSITTAIGSKVINLVNCIRSTASNAAVSGLQSKGFTVTVGLAQQFTFDLGQNVTINGSVTRAEGHDGRLNAIQFGSGNLVSADNLPISYVWSVSFWMKTTQTSIGKVLELTANANSLFGFYIETNVPAAGNLWTVIKNSNLNAKPMVGTVINNSVWNHYVIIVNRAETTQNEIKVYVNKVLQTDATHPSFSTDSTGNFVSDKLYIGGRGTNYASPFNGVLSPIKMFNYPLTQTEIDNLYNE